MRPHLHQNPLSNLQLDYVAPFNPPPRLEAGPCSSPPFHLCPESFLSPSAPHRCPTMLPLSFLSDCPRTPHICPVSRHPSPISAASPLPLSRTWGRVPHVCSDPPPLQPGSRLALHPWLPCPSLAGVCLSVHPPRLSSHPRGVEPGTKRTLPQPRGLAGWAREGAVGFEVGGHSRSRLGPREVRPAAGVERAKGLALAGGGAPGPRDTARPPVLPAAGRGPGTSSGAPCPPPWTHHPLFH